MLHFCTYFPASFSCRIQRYSQFRINLEGFVSGETNVKWPNEIFCRMFHWNALAWLEVLSWEIKVLTFLFLKRYCCNLIYICDLCGMCPLCKTNKQAKQKLKFISACSKSLFFKLDNFKMLGIAGWGTLGAKICTYENYQIWKTLL